MFRVSKFLSSFSTSFFPSKSSETFDACARSTTTLLCCAFFVDKSDDDGGDTSDDFDDDDVSFVVFEVVALFSPQQHKHQ